MTIPEQFLVAMQELKSKFAAEALAPSKRDETEFGYGKACGVYQGLLLAEERFNDILSQVEKKERMGDNR